MLNTGITNEKADEGENDEWSHLLGFNHEMVTMTAKKGKFEFDDKMKDGAKKAGQDIKEGGGDLIDGVKKAGHELKEDISELGGKTKKKPKE
jgi:hypothetical protein